MLKLKNVSKYFVTLRKQTIRKNLTISALLNDISLVSDQNKTVKKADYTVLPRSHAPTWSTKLGAYVSKDVIMKKSNQRRRELARTSTLIER